jgi:hypothetical protein
VNHAKGRCTVLATCLGLAAACLGLSACGGSSSSGTASLSSFKSAFAADQAQFRQFGTQLGKSIAGAASKTDAALATEFSQLSSRAQGEAAKLAELKPPAKYKPTVNKLTAAFKAIASDLSGISSAAVKHDASAAKAASAKLVGAAESVKSSDGALSKPLGLTPPAG